MKRILIFLGVLLLTLGLVVGSANAVLTVVSDSGKTFIDWQSAGVSIFKIDDEDGVTLGTACAFNVTQTGLVITDALGNGRRMHWQYTASSIESGEQLQGLQIRASWGGSADSTGAGITGIEIKARAADNTITHSIGTARAIVANVDCKKSTFVTAWGVESQFDLGAGGTITTGAAFRASLNNSGTFSTSYAYLVETANTSYNWDYGLYMASGQTDVGIFLGGTQAIQFYDALVNIAAADDGDLVINADATLIVTSPSTEIVATTSTTVTTPSFKHARDANDYVTTTIADTGTVLVNVTGDGAGSYEIQTDDGAITLDSVAAIELEATTLVNVTGRLVVSDTFAAATDTSDFDIEIPFGTTGNYHTPAVEIDVTTTSHVGTGIWSAWGRLYGQRITVNLAHKVTNTFGLKAEVITTGTTNINDVVGVMGSLEIDGTHTKGQTASSMAALRGDINNTSDGSWDAQVYTLFLNYGSGKNYGGTTAWIHAYNHGDSYLDYGIHLCQNSTTQAITTGVWLDIAASTTVTTGIHLDNAGTLTTGIDIGAATVGIQTASPIFVGTDAAPITITSADYQLRVDTTVAAQSTGWFNAVAFDTEVTAGDDITGDAQVVGIQAYARLQNGTTWSSSGGLCGFSSVLVNTGTISMTSGVASAISAVLQPNATWVSTDAVVAGIVIQNQTNASATIQAGNHVGLLIWDPGTALDLDYAISISSDTCTTVMNVASNTNLFSFTGEGTNPVSAHVVDENSTGRIRILVGGATRYLYYYD